MNNAFDKLKDIKPRSGNSLAPEASQAVDDIALGRGFVKDFEEPAKKLRRGSKNEPTTSVTMRVHVESWNMYVEWCERERIPYKEAFDTLLKKAGLL